MLIGIIGYAKRQERNVVATSVGLHPRQEFISDWSLSLNVVILTPVERDALQHADVIDAALLGPFLMGLT